MFLIEKGGKPKRLPAATFQTEDEFQRLLADFPELLTDEDFGEGSPRKWLLVTREAMVPDSQDGSGRWSLDHLFLDQDGVPTLVEIKRASDPRVRREVVAQMLDYAANAARWWKAQDIERWLEERCRREGSDSATQLSDQLGVPEPEKESYWRRVETNLKSKTLRLIFVADKIERELSAIVEFLNEQMRSVTVVALELSLFSNGSERILTPRLFGLTADAEAQKRVSGAPDISVDEWLASVAQQTTIESSRKFVNLMKDFGASARTARGSICFDFEIGDKRLALFYLRGSGKAALSLYNLAKLAPFADENQRRALCDDLMSQGLKLSPARLNGEPTFQLPAIEDAKEWEALRAILSDILSRARHREPIA